MKAFYAGSFDPFTVGHYSIAMRAMELFDSIVIGVGYNEKKKHEWPVEKRIDDIRRLFAGNEKVEVLAYTGLTSHAAKESGAGVLVRGVRNSEDFVKEKELADINLEVFGIPTVMLPAEPQYSYVSSSMVRELKHFGHDPSKFLPNPE